jgi:hypothetical protein
MPLVEQDDLVVAQLAAEADRVGGLPRAVQAHSGESKYSVGPGTGMCDASSP